MPNSPGRPDDERTDSANIAGDPHATGLDAHAAQPVEAELQRLRDAADRAPRLLQNLRIGNVKSLAGEHTVPLAPLTLIYGPNAAGKSTIIQSLQLLAQSVQADDFEPRGPLVDVRDFRHVVSGHDLERAITLGIEFGIEVGTRTVSNPKADYLEDLSDLGGGLVPRPGRESLPLRVASGMKLTFREKDGSPETFRSLWLGGGAAITEPDPPVPFTDRGEDKDGIPYESDPFDLRWRMDLSGNERIDTLLSAIEAWNEADYLYDYPDEDEHLLGFQKWAEHDLELLRFAKDHLEPGTAKSVTLDLWFRVDSWSEEPGRRAPARLFLVVKPHESPDAPEQFRRKPAGQGAQSLTPGLETQQLLESWANGDPLPGAFEMKALPHMFQKVDEEGRRLLTYAVTSLGPIRPAPGREYLESDARGSAALGLVKRLYESDLLLSNVNDWFRWRLEIPYSIDVDRLVWKRSGTEVGYSLGLTDTRANVDVSLADVGYGVSQILPIVVECLDAKKRVICIEQPELHLHPRLQANLGDLFADSVNGHGKKQNGTQIIAETHSKSILLRVQRLVRQGTLAPDDVAVIYVDNSQDDGVSVRRLHLGVRGQLLDPWPTGFFDDNLRDVLGIAE